MHLSPLGFEVVPMFFPSVCLFNMIHVCSVLLLNTFLYFVMNSPDDYKFSSLLEPQNIKILFLPGLYNYYWQTGIEFSLAFYSLIRNKISRAFIVCTAIFVLLPLGHASLVSENKNSNSHHPTLSIPKNLISFVLINMMNIMRGYLCCV